MAEKFSDFKLKRFTLSSPYERRASKKNTKDRGLNHSVVEMFDWFDLVNADYSIVDFEQLAKTVDQSNKYEENMPSNGTPRGCSENFDEVMKEFFASSNITTRKEMLSVPGNYTNSKKAYSEGLQRGVLHSSEVLSRAEFLDMLKISEDCFDEERMFQISAHSPLMDVEDPFPPKTSREGKSKVHSGFYKKGQKQEEENSTISSEDIEIFPSEFILTNKVPKARIALANTKGRDIGFRLKWDASFLSVSPIQGIIPAKGELGLRVCLLPRRKYGNTVISVILNNAGCKEIKITVKK